MPTLSVPRRPGRSIRDISPNVSLVYQQDPEIPRRFAISRASVTPSASLYFRPQLIAFVVSPDDGFLDYRRPPLLPRARSYRYRYRSLSIERARAELYRKGSRSPPLRDFLEASDRKCSVPRLLEERKFRWFTYENAAEEWRPATTLDFAKLQSPSNANGARSIASRGSRAFNLCPVAIDEISRKLT